MTDTRYHVVLVVLLCSYQLTAYSAGFGLSEQSGSGLGNAFAGASAIAEDASTIYYNPAGMTYLEGTQIAGALYAINTNGHFHNAQSQAAAGRPLGDSGGNLGDLAILPNIYYKQDLSDKIKLGLGISSPFGLKTEYDDAWIGRFQALKSDLKTVNINPSMAWKINDRWSVGFGLSAMWAQATLTSAVNLGAGGESSVKNKGDDWGVGFNLGTIYQATEDTRIGIAYRSKVSQHLKGTANSAVTALNAIPTRTLNTDIQADITLPESLSFSTFSKMNDRWDLLTDITWTRWSRFKELNIVRDNGTGSILGSTIEHWNNTLRYSAAVNYHYTERLKLRSGMAYDQEAIDNTYRTARIPGNDRIWLSFGASWQWSPHTKFDAGYAHLFIKNANINDNQSALNRGVINGQFTGHADILSMQLSHKF